MFTNNGFNPRPVVRISYNKDWEEFVVKLEGKPNADYFTNDAFDALSQARFNVREHGYRIVISANARSRIKKVEFM